MSTKDNAINRLTTLIDEERDRRIDQLSIISQLTASVVSGLPVATAVARGSLRIMASERLAESAAVALRLLREGSSVESVIQYYLEALSFEQTGHGEEYQLDALLAERRLRQAKQKILAVLKDCLRK